MEKKNMSMKNISMDLRLVTISIIVLLNKICIYRRALMCIKSSFGNTVYYVELTEAEELLQVSEILMLNHGSHGDQFCV